MNKRDMFLTGAAAGVVMGGLTWLLTRKLTEPAEVTPLSDGEPFPTISGTLLTGEELTVPEDLLGSVSVLLLGWDYAARLQVEEWTRYLGDTFAGYPEMAVLIMPMIDGAGRLLRGVINASMQRGTPEAEQSHVLTVFGDLRALRRRLGVDDARRVQVFVLGRTGRVAWHADGPPSEERKAAFNEALATQGVKKE